MINLRIKKWLAGAAILGMLFAFSPLAQASPWARKDGYLAKTGGKFIFGLQHSLFSWLSIYFESDEPQYAKPWQGFCVGIGKMLIYTPTGLIQLVTFPIPVDFPNVGLGLHIANKNCPACHWDYKLPEKSTFAKRSSKKVSQITALPSVPVEKAASEMEAQLKEQMAVSPPPPAAVSEAPVSKSAPAESEEVPAASVIQEETEAPPEEPVLGSETTELQDQDEKMEREEVSEREASEDKPVTDDESDQDNRDETESPETPIPEEIEETEKNSGSDIDEIPDATAQEPVKKTRRVSSWAK